MGRGMQMLGTKTIWVRYEKEKRENTQCSVSQNTKH